MKYLLRVPVNVFVSLNNKFVWKQVSKQDVPEPHLMRDGTVPSNLEGDNHQT